MNFLEQHFYIDAGVNLPTKSLSDSQIKKSASVGKLTNSLISKLPAVAASSNAPEESLEKLTELSCNITDDDKVNLRKLADGKATPKKNKRYSSVFSTTCLEKNQERKALNRRSLNITMKETSKIPVSCKGSGKIVLVSEESKDNKKDNKNGGAIARINIEKNNLQAESIKKNDIPNDNKQNAENENTSNILLLEGNNSSNECSFKAVSHLPVLKR